MRTQWKRRVALVRAPKGQMRVGNRIEKSQRNCPDFLRKRTLVAGALGLILSLLTAAEYRADEGGVSFRLPGSLAATPQAPGGSFAAAYDHTTLDGTLTASVGNLAATRQGAPDSTVSGSGDLYPQVSLRWSSGVRNYKT